MKSKWAVYLEFIYKMLEAFMLTRQKNDPWFVERANLQKAEEKAAAEALAARVLEATKPAQGNG